ncbi:MULTISPECIES: extracellular solute-binding protein [unclassified Haladaptatus]|uniref:extracellular solute-binding protein n=1 Tax=unclassified Haladaptatus TaxID=2622732 RepID=UPI00209C3AEB|nr:MULTISPECIES: extracellular solute-binding protein [unclassified Haladaptatus]MCO8245184.1 extracellular solute-binding protein [Haladaptatus sp. AB643]MCO8253328.1 extracellular solute-binding protein [Haladaptatus sp. AB618]
MVGVNDHDRDRRRDGVSRRTFVKAVGVSGTAAGLAGCTSRGQSANSNVVKWAADSDAADQQKPINDALHKAGLSKDIHVEILPGSSNTDVRQAQYQRWLSADLAEPDMLMMDSGWALTFIARRQVMNLSENLPENLTKKVNKDYFQASVQTAKSNDDDLYAIPIFPDFPTMQYRKDLVKKAGFSPDKEKWATNSVSWKKFSKVVKKVKEQNDLKYGFTFQADLYEGLSCCDFNEFMTSWGGAFFGPHDNLFGPIGKRPVTVAEDPVIKSIKMIRTFIHGSNASGTLQGYEGGISPTAVLSWSEETSRAPFTNKQAVAHRNWPYSIVINGADDVFGKDLGVMPIPYGVKPNEAKYKGTGGPAAALGGWHMVVNPNTPKRKQTFEVIRAMMQPSVKLKLFQILGWIPPEPQLLKSKQAKQVPVIGRYVNQLRVAGQNAVPRPVTAVWPQESGKIAQQVHAAYANEASPESAMSTLKSQLSQIENYNK